MDSTWLWTVLGIKSGMLALVGVWVANKIDHRSRVSWLRGCALGIVALPVLSLWFPAFEVPLLPASPREIVNLPISAAPPIESGPSLLPNSPPQNDWRPVRLMDNLPWVFAAALGALLLHLVWQLIRLRQWMLESDPTSPHERSLWHSIAAGDSRIAIRWSRKVTSPVSFGWLRPVVLLPQCWRRDCRHPRLKHALAHEVAHIANLDWPWLMFQKILWCATWWNPAVVWLLRRLEQETELACDRQALRVLDSPGDYARTLLELASCPRPAAVVAMSGAREWRQRIENTMNFRTEDCVMKTGIKTLHLLLPVLVVVPLAACQLTRAAETPAVVDVPEAPTPDSFESAETAPLAPTAHAPTAAVVHPAPPLAADAIVADVPAPSVVTDVSLAPEPMSQEELEYRRQIRDERKRAARVARAEARELRDRSREEREEARVMRDKARVEHLAEARQRREVEGQQRAVERARRDAEKARHEAQVLSEQVAVEQLAREQDILADSNSEMRREMAELQAELARMREELDRVRTDLESARDGQIKGG